ncbi:MAG TPA: hypothetical protein VFE62_10315 [Gemmataceae bacterium]|nr:hypothetical protein [Gemmataceae bacterium]
MFPIIGLLGWMAVVGGGITLAWYYDLSQEEQEKADGIACDYAKELFNKSLSDLSERELARVTELTKKRLGQ